MHEPSARPRQVFFSVALSAAALAVTGPPSLRWSSPPAPVAAVLEERPDATLIPQPFASYRARVRPSFPVPTPSATPPRVSDDLAAARLIPSPAPTPTPPPAPAAREATQAPQPPSPSPYPSYTDLPSSSGAYGSAQAYAESLVGQAQFACLQPLWDRESGWNAYAQNPTSGAYGIPQALPGSKMASAGPDWATNPDTQVRWGIQYLNDTYGSPCGGWAHEQAYGWY
jgi:transglycosylase-like protein with SLT domain